MLVELLPVSGFCVGVGVVVVVIVVSVKASEDEVTVTWEVGFFLAVLIIFCGSSNSFEWTVELVVVFKGSWCGEV